jgi:Anti-sigma-K factor rskA/Putative zinc-finger
VSDIHAAVGSYAVEALNPSERAEFEAHLENCASCRSEAREYADTLAELSLLSAARPPAALRSSVLAAVAGVHQPAPQRSSSSGDKAAKTNGQEPTVEAAPRRALAPVTELRPLEPHEVAPLEEHPSVVPDMPWLGVAAALTDDVDRRSRRWSRVLIVLVAVALVAALALGAWVYVSRQQIQAQASQAQRETELLTAPDVRLYPSTVNGVPVSYVVSEQRNEVLFIGQDLERLGGDSTYHLWAVTGETGATIGKVRGGDVRVLFWGPLRDADRLVLTLEPDAQEFLPTGPELSEVSLS